MCLKRYASQIRDVVWTYDARHFSPQLSVEAEYPEYGEDERRRPNAFALDGWDEERVTDERTRSNTGASGGDRSVSTRRRFLRTGIATATGTAVVALSGCLGVGGDNAISTVPTFTSTSKRITKSDATHVVSSADDLRSALGEKGATVWVPGDQTLDVSGFSNVTIAPGVTLASNRRIGNDSAEDAGETAGTGALLRYDTVGSTAFYSEADDVRITGLRVRGPRTDFFDPGSSGAAHDSTVGFRLLRGRFVVDNCELFGWTESPLVFGDEGIDAKSWVHHNDVHHNQMQHRGYGVNLLNGAHVVEWNTFDANRHAVAASGFPTCGYEARYNVCGPTTIYHLFDMHAAREVQPGDYGDANVAGKYVKIHHNVVGTSHSNAVGIRGVPAEESTVHDNWFVGRALPTKKAVVQQTVNGNRILGYRNLRVEHNHYGVDAAKSGVESLERSAREQGQRVDERTPSSTENRSNASAASVSTTGSD